jgi:hypothetical protein
MKDANTDQLDTDHLALTSEDAMTAVLLSRTNGTKLKDYGEHLDVENFDLIAKVIELLDTHDLWEPNGTYSFKDGERWAQFKPEENDNE